MREAPPVSGGNVELSGTKWMDVLAKIEAAAPLMAFLF
jgi:hypothetical protein